MSVSTTEAEMPTRAEQFKSEQQRAKAPKAK